MFYDVIVKIWRHDDVTSSFFDVNRKFIRCLILVPSFLSLAQGSFLRWCTRSKIPHGMFQKLVNLGIGMFMLRSLIEMYSMTDAYLFLNREYSRKLQVSSVVLQGAASSTIPLTAYTCNIINLFQKIFNRKVCSHKQVL